MDSFVSGGGVSKPPILIIDDNVDLTECVSDMLAEEGYEVFTAPTGADGLVEACKLRDRPCVVVLLDIVLPDVDSVTLIGRMCDANLVNLKLVAFTAYQVSMVPAQFTNVLLKPTDIETIIKTVVEVCR